jgi:hypothetical protein
MELESQRRLASVKGPETALRRHPVWGWVPELESRWGWVPELESRWGRVPELAKLWGDP